MFNKNLLYPNTFTNFFSYKAKIVCRDISSSRIDRLKRMLKSYLREKDIAQLVDIEFNIEKIGLQDKIECFDKVLNLI